MKQYKEFRIVESNELYKMTVKEFLIDLGIIEKYNADMICLVEVYHRHAVLAEWALQNNYRLVHVPNHDHLVTGDCALLFNKETCDVLLTGVEQLHDEPPGSTTDRQAPWAIVKHLPTGRVVRAVGEHTVAAVERGNRFNLIPRTKFWIIGIKRTITLDRKLKKLAKKATGQYGSAVVTGDFNWSDRPGSNIRKMLGVYFKSNYQVLGVPKRGTLGKRHVDIVWIRGYIKFVSHRIFHTLSDHEGLFVICKLPVMR